METFEGCAKAGADLLAIEEGVVGPHKDCGYEGI